MRLTRRRFLKQAGAGGVAALGFPAIVRGVRAEDPVRIAALHDRTGPHGVYGREMSDAAALAADEINASGGIAGRPVELILLDTATNMQNYAGFAERVATEDRAAAVFGGVSSASSEIVRPILDRHGVLYFYSTFYEGGACDRTLFVNAETPAQLIGPALGYAAERYGAARVYAIWPDYNYGEACAGWLRAIAAQGDLEIVATDFYPLDVPDYAASIGKIRESAPDLVISGLVGTSFYRQWHAAGMLGEIPLYATALGPWEKNAVEPEKIEGVISAFHYYEAVETPGNGAFLERWHGRFGADYPEIGSLAVCTYDALQLWRQAAEAAGSAEPDAMVEALQAGVAFDGPGGAMALHPASHHAIMDIHVAEVRAGRFEIVGTVPNVEPADTTAVCDLIANPDQSTEYAPES